MVVFVCCRDYPLLFEIFNMLPTKSSKELKTSTDEPIKRGESPRVGAVLQALDPATWTQSSLAAKASLNRGVLNQLWQGKTSSTPLLVGRLIAVLPKKDATNLLAAYLEDVLAIVATEAAEAPGADDKSSIKAALKVSFPPPVVQGAA